VSAQEVGGGKDGVRDRPGSRKCDRGAVDVKADLREICTGIFATPPRKFEATLETKDGVGIEHPLVPLCVVCGTPMREVKGKWACPDASCAMYGREVKR
jgi:hypothetical protein